jgi:hypothetical protein
MLTGGKFVGFSKLSTAFKDAPSIEHYVRLRRQHPNKKIEIAISGALEWLWDNEDTLTALSISPDLVAGALDADHKSISELSLLLLERIIERDAAQNGGATHLVSRGKAISDTLVNYLINMMLDALEWNDEMTLHRDLIVLIRHQTGGGICEWNKEERLRELRQEAKWTAIKMACEGKEPSYRTIGKALGVNATTVMRWFDDGTCINELKKVAHVVRESQTSANDREKVLRAKSRA